MYYTSKKKKKRKRFHKNIVKVILGQSINCHKIIKRTILSFLFLNKKHFSYIYVMFNRHRILAIGRHRADRGSGGRSGALSWILSFNGVYWF